MVVTNLRGKKGGEKTILVVRMLIEIKHQFKDREKNKTQSKKKDGAEYTKKSEMENRAGLTTLPLKKVLS